MAKSAQAFRTIREVADWLGVAAHVLRFWESKFSQIKPVKRAGGRRYYRPSDMELVGGIKVLLHDRGMTIRGVKKMISDEGIGAVTALSPAIDSLLEEPDVIDITPDQAWEDDAVAEQADETDDTVDASEDVAAASAIADQPDEDSAAEPDDAGPEPAPSTAQEATASASEPDADAPSPETDPIPVVAFGQLEALAALAQRPGALTPHLAALKSLQARMGEGTSSQ